MKEQSRSLEKLLSTPDDSTGLSRNPIMSANASLAPNFGTHQEAECTKSSMATLRVSFPGPLQTSPGCGIARLPKGQSCDSRLLNDYGRIATEDWENNPEQALGVKDPCFKFQRAGSYAVTVTVSLGHLKVRPSFWSYQFRQFKEMQLA